MPSFFFDEMGKKIHQLKIPTHHHQQNLSDEQVENLVKHLKCHCEIVLRRIEIERFVSDSDPESNIRLSNLGSLINQVLDYVNEKRYSELPALEIARKLRHSMNELPSASSPLAYKVGLRSGFVLLVMMPFMLFSTFPLPLALPILAVGVAALMIHLLCTYLGDSVAMARTLEEPLLGIVDKVTALSTASTYNLAPPKDTFLLEPSPPMVAGFAV